MKISLFTGELTSAPVQLVALGTFSDDEGFGPIFQKVDTWLDGNLALCCADEDFSSKADQQVLVSCPSKNSIRRVVVGGLGSRADFSANAVRKFAGTLAALCAKTSAQSIAIHIPTVDQVDYLQIIQAATEGLELGSYKFTKYLSEPGRSSKLEQAIISVDENLSNQLEPEKFDQTINYANAMSSGVNLARDLVNLPPNDLNPVALCEHAELIAQTHGLTFKALGPSELSAMGMNLHLAVNQGSTKEPRLIHLTYQPKNKTSDEVITLVGKGLTFDAGGLSLKSPEGMITMKIDMGGAAAVLGAMQSIAQSEPGCVVHGLIGAAENMPDGNATRPGDVVTGKKGISVEILNTDAEGRLVLADVLAYAQELKPTHIVDIATLTGACIVALGNLTGGVFCRNEQIAEKLSTAWSNTGEKFWRMPLQKELRELLKSDIADIKNVGDRSGGAITAALFLSEFVDKEFSWAHLDVAGPVYTTKPGGYNPTKGGTGFAVRTLVEFVHVCSR